MARTSERWLVPQGDRVHLGTVDPGSTAGAPGGKDRTRAALPALQERIAGLQDRLWAEGSRCVLVVLQGMDGSGKDGTIRHILGCLAPQATKVVAFKAPSELELAHDFLWRIHGAAPAHGEIAVFNRSHYEDVLIVRVNRMVPERVWRERYALVNAFESTLHHGGTRVLKLFLHLSKEEQKRRFEERLERPDKRWKFRRGDLDDRKRWGEYQEAYEDAISKTSRTHAPWYVIPADHKWYRNWAVSSILLEALEEMDPRYPEGEDLTGITVE
jgi:PPK2 family polyphosphate:nucleotide phosphotransferase